MVTALSVASNTFPDTGLNEAEGKVGSPGKG